MRRAITALLTSALAACALLFGLTGPASAAGDGSFWTANQPVSGMTTFQGHFVNSGGRVRADGYNVKFNSGQGGITRIVLDERLSDNTYYGTREINFTGTATSSYTSGISEKYLPFMPKDGRQAKLDIYVWTNGGAGYYSMTFNIG